jgi:hypothetical protein
VRFPPRTKRVASSAMPLPARTVPVAVAYVRPLFAATTPAKDPIVSAGVVRAPVEAIVVEPVWPKAAVLARRLPEKSEVDVAFVVVRPPLNASSVVVAFPGNG